MDNFNELIKIQNQIRQGLLREQELDKRVSVLSLINELTSGPKESVQKESLIVEAANKGISEEDLNKEIEKLEKDNIIFEPKPGFIKKK